jgi:signal transduction histidine kinase/ligand-binding sensor domain-containing protein
VPRWRTLLRTSVLVCALSAPAAAQNPPESPIGYAVTVWTIKDGLHSGDIRAISQDKDGYLWLGTRDGLVRFDGLEFVPGPSGDSPSQGTVVSALIGGRDGSLWAGFADSPGVSHIQHGQVVSYNVRDGLPEGMITVLLEDRQGTVWAGGLGGLAAFRGNSWQRVGAEAGLPSLGVFSLHEDRAGRLWAGTSAGVFQRPAGGSAFQLYDGSSKFVQSFAEDRDGSVWVNESRTIVRQLAAKALSDSPRTVELPGPARALIFDQHGTLWVAGLGEGLFRIKQPAATGNPSVELFQDERMLGGAARSLFEDRDGNLWVGMRGGGLLRMSRSAIKTDVPLQGHTNDGVRALAATPDGSIWVATGHRLNQLNGDRTRAFPVDDVLALHTDRTGALWVITPRAISRYTDGRFAVMPAPPGVRLERVFSLTSDAQGALWLCSYDEGVMRWHGGTLTRVTEGTPVNHNPCNVIFTDSSDRVWIGFTSGSLSVYENGALRTYGASERLASGAVVAIYQDRHEAIWIASVNALTRIRGGQIVTADKRHGLPARLVPSLVDDADGDMWLGTESGAQLIRFSPAEMDRIADNPSHQITYSVYDESDGLLGPMPRWGRPTAVRARDGHLWVFSGGQIAVLDPRQPPMRRSAPVPRIERVALDGKDVSPLTEFVVPPRTRTLEIDYGAVSLSSASKLRFRYKLEGLSNEWVDAGSRRQISYTNLEAGTYRFQVGVTSDGHWSDTATSIAFTVYPPFYRTYWFYALGIAIIGFAAWGVWWLRLRAIRREFAVVIAERARVSREIHDTLLQSLGALTVQLEIVSRSLDSSQSRAHTALQRLRKNLVHCVRDARRSVWELRSLRLEQRNLVEAIEDMADETMVALPVSIRVEVRGKVRQCAPDVEQHLLRIAQEAISNAVQHGHADEVVIELDYQGSSLSMSVRDNGRGFVLEEAMKDTGEHWGLVNMRERVTRMGGKLSVNSVLGEGTVVTAVSPI